MAITLAQYQTNTSGLTVTGSASTPYIPGSPTTTWNASYTGVMMRATGVNTTLLNQAELAVEIVQPPIVDNQSYPGVPASRAFGGAAGIRLGTKLPTTMSVVPTPPFVFRAYQNLGPSNTVYPLSVGEWANYGSPTSQYQGGIQVEGMSFFSSTPLGTTSTPAGSWTAFFQRSPSAPTNATNNSTVRIEAGSPGVAAYYVRFGQTGSITGTISTPGSTTTYGTSSDYRLKENITPLDAEEELQKINQLRPRRWNWKNNQDPGIGFIAHEIQEVIDDSEKLGIASGSKDAITRQGRIVDIVTGEPIFKETKIDDVTGEETITYSYVVEPSAEESALLVADGREWVYTHDEPSYQSIDTSFLASSIVAAIQALTDRVTSLESRVAALESV